MKNRCRIELVLVIWLLGVLVNHAPAQTITDDFSRYAADSDGSPDWEPQAVGWAMLDGRYEGDTGFTVWRKSPYAAALNFAADLTVEEVFSREWATAGLAIFADERNYWAVNLVTAPESMKRRHSAEMQEMLDGVWLAASQPKSKLQHLPGKEGFDWRPGQIYRLEIRLAAAEISGCVRQEGKEMARFGYRFAEGVPAVRAGRPAFRLAGMKARFDNASLSVEKTAEEPKPVRQEMSPWQSRPGDPMAAGTGFFRTLNKDGRWWLLDPEGKPFFSVGADHTSYRGHWCEKLGYSPYHRNMAAKYGSEARWGEATLERLRAWGFNTLPAGHTPSLRRQGLPHILFASFGASFARREYICEPIHWTGFPDVFSQRWEGHCRFLARHMARESLGDPWCIGVFLDNELEWYGKKGHLVDEVFRGNPRQAAKKALWAWMVARFGNVAELNRRLRAHYADQAAFLAADRVPGPSDALDEVREGFLAEIAERYFGVAARAMRAADPNHLVVGCRFAGRTPKPVLAAAGRHNDVFTINTYPRVEFEDVWTPDGIGGFVEKVPREFTEYYAVVQKPFMITEWSFPALDSGLPCKHGAGMRVDTQEQKAACYRIFARAMADLPFVAGYQYFMWVDEPALGISATFPEDSNYGLVNEQDVPYQPFVRVVTEVNREAAARHARSRSSTDLAVRALPHGIEIVNESPSAAYGRLYTVIGDKKELAEVDLRPNERRVAPFPADKQWSAELQIWDGSRTRLAGGPSIEKTIPVRSVRPESLALKSASTTWICQRKNGSLFDEIRSGDLAIGRLVFAAHQVVQGQEYWTEAERISSLELREFADGWTVEAVADRPPAPSGPAGFRARLQAVVFKRLDLVLVRPVWLENADARPWRLASAFWFCRSAIGGNSSDDKIDGPGVPNYYRPAQFISDAKLGGCFGALHQPDGWHVTFWQDEGKMIHPDSRIVVDRELKPSERWTDDHLPFLWVFASADRNTWKELSKQARRAGNFMMPETPIRAQFCR